MNTFFQGNVQQVFLMFFIYGKLKCHSHFSTRLSERLIVKTVKCQVIWNWTKKIDIFNTFYFVIWKAWQKSVLFHLFCQKFNIFPQKSMWYMRVRMFHPFSHFLPHEYHYQHNGIILPFILFAFLFGSQYSTFFYATIRS